MDMDVKRGDVFYADLYGADGMEEKGTRPVVILANNVGNRTSQTTIIAPISSRFEFSGMPVHTVVPAGNGGLTKPSIVMLEQIRAVDKKRLVGKVGKFSDVIMDAIDRALKIRGQSLFLWDKGLRVYD